MPDTTETPTLELSQEKRNNMSEQDKTETPNDFSTFVEKTFPIYIVNGKEVMALDDVQKLLKLSEKK